MSNSIAVPPQREIVADTSGQRVRVRAWPTTQARQLGWLTNSLKISYRPAVPGDAVSYLKGTDWLPVTLLEGPDAGVTGYVHADLLAMPDADKHFVIFQLCEICNDTNETTGVPA